MESLLDLFHLYLVPVVIGVPVALYLLLRGPQHEDEDSSLPRAGLVPAGAAPLVMPRRAVGADLGVPSQPATVADAPEILVVDDSAVARAKLRKLLEGAGYAVTLANDGAQALEALALNSRFALLITDLEMPNMNGFELIAAVQGALETEDLPIVAITGHDEMQARVHDCQGLYGIFKKPWNDRELLKRVGTLVSLRKVSRV